MCQCLSQRRDKHDLDYLQKCQRDVKYNLDDTVVKYSVSRGFCVTWCHQSYEWVIGWCFVVSLGCSAGA